jgi:hypothetical protein
MPIADRSRKYERVAASAGKKLSIMSSDIVSSVAVPKMVVALMKLRT